MKGYHVLHETVTLGAAGALWLAGLRIPLQSHLLELSERLKDGGEILFCHAEVDVTNVEAVERSGAAIGTIALVSSRSRSRAGCSVLLCLGVLSDDRNTFQFLSCKLDSLGN
jgi:hypothetical protein